MGFSAFTAFHGWRVSNTWQFYGPKEKVFNVLMLGALSGISLLNYYAGYRTYLGQTMSGEVAQPIAYRESYKERLSKALKFQRMSDDEKLEYIKAKI